MGAGPSRSGHELDAYAAHGCAVDTPLGRKTQIDQNSCNCDYGCMKGDCPAFMTVEAHEDFDADNIFDLDDCEVEEPPSTSRTRTVVRMARLDFPKRRVRS